MNYEFKSKLWVWAGPAAWHFVSVPKTQTKIIKQTFGDLTRGFGSLKVEATIGSSSWLTSIFPDSKTNTYLLPVKNSIRKKEDLVLDKQVKVRIRILV